MGDRVLSPAGSGWDVCWYVRRGSGDSRTVREAKKRHARSEMRQLPKAGCLVAARIMSVASLAW
jgi:hypothetical protein